MALSPQKSLGKIVLLVLALSERVNSSTVSFGVELPVFGNA
jgi:hypothetical protein